MLYACILHIQTYFNSEFGRLFVSDNRVLLGLIPKKLGVGEKKIPLSKITCAEQTRFQYLNLFWQEKPN